MLRLPVVLGVPSLGRLLSDSRRLPRIEVESLGELLAFGKITDGAIVADAVRQVAVEWRPESTGEEVSKKALRD